MASGYDKDPPEDDGTPQLGWWISLVLTLVPAAFVYAVIVTLMGE